MNASKKEISYIISVSVVTGCYRHIKISSKATFFELHENIINAFEFYDDHAHAFFLDNKVWSDAASVFSDIIEDEKSYTSKIKLEKAGFFVGMKFKYIFDFGDEWTFQCKVLKILDEITPEPEVVRSVGEAPSQYGSEMYDEDESDDEKEEDGDGDE